MSSRKNRTDTDQNAAVALRVNAAVTAGAGSGKTTVLSRRYLALIQGDDRQEGADVRSILCLTFTRKAASEMKARVYKRLLEGKDQNSRNAVDHFAEASIATIDSFCSDILRSSAQEYGYPPDFAVDDARAYEIAEDQSLAFLLEKRAEPALCTLFSIMGFEGCWHNLFAYAAYRYGAPAPRPENDFLSMPEKQQKTIEDAISDNESSLVLSAEEVKEEIDALESQDPGSGKLIPALLKIRDEIIAFPRRKGGIAGNHADWQTLLEDLCHIRAIGSNATSDLALTLKDWQEESKSYASSLIDLYANVEWLPLYRDVLILIDEFCSRYKEAKRREGVMSFRDAAVATVDLLKIRKDIRAYWKKRYQFIMVDEFQDDDELQKELLYLLAEREDSAVDGIPTAADLSPCKLFFVGDEKQSIYRFRGADVSVFKKLKTELKSAAPNVSLKTNYRSEPKLVDFFNTLFERIFSPEPGQVLEDFEAGYEQALSRDATPGVNPKICLFTKPYISDGDCEAMGFVNDDKAIADFIALTIKSFVESKNLIIANDGADKDARPARPAEYSDFAILLRTFTNQYLLERAFRVHNIPYAAVTTCGLYLESPTNDIYNVLRLRLLPDDAKAYAAVLRSPFAGLSDDGFVRILAARGDTTSPFSEKEEQLLATDDDRARFRHGREVLSHLEDISDRSSIAETLSYLWFEGGLRLSILQRPEAHPYLEHYDYLFTMAVDADSQGENLATFVSSLEPYMGEPSKFEEEREIQREAGEGVKILSIHKSKGLEFPVVILPWLNTKSNRQPAAGGLYYSDRSGLSFTVKHYNDPRAKGENIFSRLEKEQNNAKEAAELKRLFYVACTRAESHLFFVTRGAGSAIPDSFLNLLAGNGGKLDKDTGGYSLLPDMVQKAEVPSLTIDDYKKTYSGGAAAAPEQLRNVYCSAEILDRRFDKRFIAVTSLAGALWAKDSRAALPATPLPQLECDPVLAAEFKDNGGIFGTLCHALIDDKISAAIDKRPERCDEIADSILPGDLTAKKRKSIITCANALALGFLSSELGRRSIACSDISMEKELLLKVRADGSDAFIKCRLDLMLENQDSIDIIDFKSDAEIRQGLHDYQLALYRYAVQKLVSDKKGQPQKTVRCYIFWLRNSSAEEVMLTLDADRIQKDLCSIGDSLYSADIDDE